MAEVAPLEYAVYGVLCAAKKETGPGGARRMYRIEERLDNWNDEEIGRALVSLIMRGWVVQMQRNEFGWIYYQVVD